MTQTSPFEPGTDHDVALIMTQTSPLEPGSDGDIYLINDRFSQKSTRNRVEMHAAIFDELFDYFAHSTAQEEATAWYGKKHMKVVKEPKWHLTPCW